ncbi:Putative secreted beta-lactamase [Corynebacterium glyciniphilum AJ 3170]|uniref:Putative secreted beta-lactamase n=1 Tax=Corynebacterium glyciniphilum AJ 3170 TaxID=1404245 RepID=X5DTA5_9CORY|nr:serine hydrolase domain-containing protein [Corynebacterium glyciniphilum]AHW63887.1 Putative secreted beta-lactamase [Corynebacterium glyciniphilum AJ 3170]
MEKPAMVRDAALTRIPRRRSFLARSIVVLVSGALAAGTLIAAAPAPRAFQGEPTGDPELAAEVTSSVGPGHWQHYAAAHIEGDDVTWAGQGADEHTEFEIGSITKTFTAALFADAVGRGEVAPTTRLDEIWPELQGKEAGTVDLESIAMQRSGLPAMMPPANAVDAAVSFISPPVLADPYRASDEEVVESLADISVGEQVPEYSNYGFAVLGQALSEVTGQDYADLVRQRITEPLDMDDTYVPEGAEGLSHGYGASGLPAAPWTLAGTAPAGAVRSTAHDLSIWLRAVRDGHATGAEAAVPRRNFDDHDDIGWAWFTTTTTPAVTWHNGGTGGYRSYLGFDRDSGEGIIMLSDAAVSVDGAADVIAQADDS